MAKFPNTHGGGAQTNKNGLHFEQTTSLNEALLNSGYTIQGHYVLKHGFQIGMSVPQKQLYTYFLIPMGIAIIIGSILFLFVIKLLLQYFYMPTYYSIIGFTLGSVLVLYNPISFNLVGITSILFLLLGFIIASKLEKI